MKRLYIFVGVLAIAASFVPVPTRAAEMKTDRAALAANAANFARIASDIAQVCSQIETTGSEIAVHIQGQAGTQVNSSLQRTGDHMQAALHELHQVLESISASSQYNPPNEQILPQMNMGMLRKSGEQHWNFDAIEGGSASMRAYQVRLAALTDEVQTAQGDFGVHRDRAVMRLGEALHSVAELNRAISTAAQAMQRNEECVAGKFSGDTKCK
ncbi:MAG TPA: hypothetical protein VNF68_08955 [Candidatus Baltobacteraceae bacterium]|nr:hypothetical protein [Candidatus Baltobacteraceae bacterium]